MQLDIKLKDLEGLTIHELRELARVVGVYTPNAFTKQELLAEVKELLRSLEEKINASGKSKQTNGFDEAIVGTLTSCMTNIYAKREAKRIEAQKRIKRQNGCSESEIDEDDDMSVAEYDEKMVKSLTVDPRVDKEVIDTFSFEEEFFPLVQDGNKDLTDVGFSMAASSVEKYDTEYDAGINKVTNVGFDTEFDDESYENLGIKFSEDEEPVEDEDAEVLKTIEECNKALLVSDECETNAGNQDASSIDNRDADGDYCQDDCMRDPTERGYGDDEEDNEDPDENGVIINQVICRVVKFKNELILRKHPFVRCITDRKLTKEEIEKFDLKFSDGVICEQRYDMNKETLCLDKILSSCRTKHPRSKNKFDLDVPRPKPAKELDDYHALLEYEEDHDI